MRLIDAEKVKQYILEEGFYCDTEADKEATAGEIDELFPTVDAISIEWLKKHKYFNIIDLWEKDCQLKNTKDILDKLLSEHNFKSYSDYVEYAGKITALPRDDRLDILFKEKENESNI